jgi:hypothetical protein
MRRFGELEAVIMDRPWEWGRPATVREMIGGLRADWALAWTTVMTVMDKLIIISRWAIDSRWITSGPVPGLSRRIVMTCRFALEPDT